MEGNPKDTLRVTKRIKRPSGGQHFILTEIIERRIFLVRGQKVMLAAHLAEFYSVPTKVLNQAVGRNRDRFPEDFMFQLTWEESRELLKSQTVTLKPGRGKHPKYLPYAFTEQGVAMLSSVLRSNAPCRSISSSCGRL